MGFECGIPLDQLRIAFHFKEANKSAGKNVAKHERLSVKYTVAGFELKPSYLPVS